MSADVDVNEIKPGNYELVAEMWDETISKPGEPFNYKRHRKGDIVKLNASEAKRLVLAGAVITPGSRELAIAEAAARNFLAAIAHLPDETKAQIAAALNPAGAVVTADSATDAATATTAPSTPPFGPTTPTPPAPPEPPVVGATPTLPSRPKKVASKDEWVTYAIAAGMPAEEAQALSRDQLVNRYTD